MDDRDSIALFGSEVTALVPLLRGHFTTLASRWETPDAIEFVRAEGECRRLLQAVTDLSAAYHATDCAMIGAALLHLVADSEKRMRVAMSIPAIAGSLDYLAARARIFSRFRRVVIPTVEEEQTQKQLVALLSGVEQSGVIRDASGESAIEGSLSDLNIPEYIDADESGPSTVAGAVTYYESFEPPSSGSFRAGRLEDGVDEGLDEHELEPHDWDVIRAFQSSHLIPAQPPRGEEQSAVTSQLLEASLAELDDIPPELRDFFRHEAEDDLRTLRLLVARIDEHPDDGEAVAEMRRCVHKLKGSAAQFGFAALAEAALALEEVLRELERRHELPSAADIREMDLLLDVMDGARAPVSGEQLIADALPALSPSDGGAQAAGARFTHSSVSTTVETGALRAPAPQGNERMLKLALREVDELTAHVQSLVFARAGLAATQADALTVQGDLQRIVDRLRRVGAELGDLEPSEAVMTRETTRPRQALDGAHGSAVTASATAGGDPSASVRRTEPSAWELARRRELSQTANALNEIAADLAAESASLRSTLERLAQASDGQAGASEDLQRAVMRMRLVPLGDLLPHLTFEVTRAQRTAEKHVTLTMRGEEIQIDRGVCEALREPLTQLLRNAVLHGIESPEERLAAGKFERGEIAITATCDGSELVLEVGDDGRGVSSEGLVAAAVAVGVLDPQTPEDMSASRTLALMFEPAVTTASEARLLGGRGIGLDEVRTAIERLGGTVSARTQPGKGSVFRIQTPISLTTMRALHVVACGAVYAVPFGSVARTVLLPARNGQSRLHVSADASAARAQRIERVPFAHGESAESASAPVDGEEMPVYTLCELLGFDEDAAGNGYAVVIESAEGHAAVLVDALVDEREELVRTLPRHLQRRALRGTTITPHGELAIIVDAAALIERALTGSPDVAHAAHGSDDRPQSSKSHRVLVVDDSEAVRRAIEVILLRGGYDVDQAADGIEALEYIQANSPDVVLLDVEMPRMGGMELLKVLAGRWPQSMRVAMLTSRGSQEHMESAAQLGASAYLIKPCPQDLLLETVRSLLVPAVVRS